MSVRKPTVSQFIAAWADDLALDDVPVDVRSAAARHLLDGFGTALAASRQHLGEPATAVARSLGGPPEAAIIGTRGRISAPAAALANGNLVHALDYDDTHAGGLTHATAAVLPSALAVGQQVGTSGADVLRAAIVGYEVVCRIAAASPHGFHARGIHATHASGVFSAAVIAALLTDAPPTVVVNAMGIAGSAAGGLLEFLNTGASTKQLHPGTAALNGIVAARLAAAGASGPETVFEGDKGLYAALSARPADIDSITAGLGDRWETVSIGIKPYPACQLLHAALDATAQLLGDVHDVASVVSVNANVHPDSAGIVCEPRANKIAPRTEYDAKFSLQWSVAAMLADHAVSAATYAPDSIARAGIAELAARVEVQVVAESVQAADAPGRVDVLLADGRHLVGEVAASRGTTKLPMTDDDVIAKFVTNCGNTPTTRQLADAMLALASAPSLDPLLELAAVVAEEQ